MNRLKLWLYMLVFLGAGAANLYLLSHELAGRAVLEADRDLAAGVAAWRSAEQVLAARGAAVTALAARDPALLEALAARTPEPEAKKKGKAPAPPPEEDLAAAKARREAATRAAVEQAAAALGVELPAAATWGAANPEALAGPELAADGPQKEVVALLRAAAGGTAERGYLRVNDALWYGVAQPAGEGAAVVLLLPLDAAWAAQLKRASGCDVTLDAGTPQLVTTAPAASVRAVVSAAVAAKGGAAGVGKAPPVALKKPIPFTAPLLFVEAPATRALAVSISGLPRASLVLSIDTARAFAALGQYQWTTLTVLGALLLVGILLGFIMTTEIAPQVPEPLLSAAARIEKGDFAARVPPMAGKLGTVVAALNRAAEVAQVAHAPAAAPDPFAHPPAEPAFEFPPRPAAEPPPPSPFAAIRPAPEPQYEPPPEPARPAAPAEALDDTQRIDGAPAEPAAPPEAPPAPTPAPARGAFAAETFTARPVPRPTVAVTTAGMTAVGMPALGAELGPAPEEDEEGHWRAVHQEFLRIRGECGEPVDGLGFERFRPKLEKNRDALIAKYGCRTVRFQVYVKEGKAALKATPVR